MDNNTLSLVNRVQIDNSFKNFDNQDIPRLKLQEAILVGNYHNQVKI